MFLGEFRHSLDDKSRITLPAKFRSELQQGVVMTAGMDHYVLIYPRAEFELLAEKVNHLPLTGRDAATLRRLLFVNANDAIPDKQGRIIVPELLRQYASISADVVIVGVGKFIEMWSPEEWQRARSEIAEHAAQESIWAKLGI
ncbi:MAG: division/cell wall cluster transcriptional repressor MraZ [Chloroflexi bacterium]|nr:division/cell wall cluster transcriptional repressor MraZ [Chloroflexota bacterium]MCL5274224.1 division/cell wall cluster transcriptional repressor MraZ [Chloroflexota bacterium]